MENKKTSEIFHVSEINLDKRILIPEVPNNFLTRNGYEDSITKRVCFSTSVGGALSALSKPLKGKTLYVFKPTTAVPIYEPDYLEVPDHFNTGEVWVKEAVMLEYVGRVKINNTTFKVHYTYGDKKIGENWYWDWKWI